MSRPRKDYGCPLRIYAHASATLFTAFPPRSARAANSYRNWVGAWQCAQVHTWPFQEPTVHEAMAFAGPHLGQRIHWHDLPPEVQRFVRLSFLGEYCPTEAQS